MVNPELKRGIEAYIWSLSATLISNRLSGLTAVKCKAIKYAMQDNK